MEENQNTKAESKVGYIWPRWKQAQLLLVEKIYKRTGVDVSSIVMEWFENTVFNLQYRTIISKEVLMRLREDKESYLSYVKEQAALHIAKRIVDSDMFVSEINSQDVSSETLTMTVLVVGVPRFIKNEKTGKLKYIRD